MENPVRSCYSLRENSIANFGSPTSAVKGNQDRLLRRFLVRDRSPYVQRKAVFTLRRTQTTGKGINYVLGLGCKAGEVDGPRSGLRTVAGDTQLT